MYFIWNFKVRCILRCLVDMQKGGMPCYLCRSPLLSTIVLNDMYILNKNSLAIYIKKSVRGQSEAESVCMATYDQKLISARPRKSYNLKDKLTEHFCNYDWLCHLATCTFIR